MSMTRREFLKAAASAGAAVAVAPAIVNRSAQAAEEEAAAIGKHTWEVKPAPITDVTATYDYDIVIVGAGMAGNAAAEAAARNGAKVAVLERTDGIQFRGVDISAFNSDAKIALDGPIDTDTACKLLYLWSQQTTNYELIRTWAERTPEVFNYLEKMVREQGLDIVSALSGTAKYGWDTLPERWRIYPDAVSYVRGDEKGDSRGDGKQVAWNIGEAMNKSAVDNGAEFIFNTHAEQLVGDAESGITGVIATNENGEYVQYNASKGVILATGDICGNQEMIDAFAPICNRADANIYTPQGGNTGDAILMGCWAGAAISKSPAAPMVHQFTMQSYTFNLTAFIMTWLAVNQEGNRYGAEVPFEPYLTNARMNTPGNKAWSIFDSNYETYVKKQWPTKYEQWLDGIEEEMNDRLGDTLFKADTIEELAEMIGVPAENLQASIDSFNAMYDQGQDTLFDVPEQFLSRIDTPPYYATPLVCSLLTIPFGLHVNKNSQVCTEDDKPIDGLFAVGNAQGDFFGLAYPVHCPGISHGRSITFGQLVGEALAKDTVISDLDFE